MAAWARALPVALLVAVGAGQIVLAKAANLTPWLGGGFGMFSTTDSGANRHLYVVGIYPGLRVELPTADLPGDLTLSARIFPDASRLRAVAEALAVPHPDWGTPESIEIQVFRTRFDASSLASHSELLGSMTLRVDDR